MDYTPTIKKIGMGFLKDHEGTDYKDDDIVIIKDFKTLPVKGALQLDMIVILICSKGQIEVNVNGKMQRAGEGDLLICPPNAYIDNYMVSPDFECNIIGLSYSKLQRTLHVSKNIWNIMQYAIKNPVIHLQESNLLLLNTYYPLFTLKIEQAHNCFHKEIMNSLLQAAFYEICAMLSNHLQTLEDDDDMKQGDILFRKFLELLSDEEFPERSVTAYALKLCITPKYLSTISKKVSGKTALQWIHEYTMENILMQLKYSEKSIKEISDMLHFPNLSFFCKFVKAHLGVSPQQYRKHFNKK